MPCGTILVFWFDWTLFLYIAASRKAISLRYFNRLSTKWAALRLNQFQHRFAIRLRARQVEIDRSACGRRAGHPETDQLPPPLSHARAAEIRPGLFVNISATLCLVCY